MTATARRRRAQPRTSSTPARPFARCNLDNNQTTKPLACDINQSGHGDLPMVAASSDGRAR